MMLLANSIIWQTQQKPLYNQFLLAGGKMIPTTDILSAEATLLKTEVATIFLFYTTLWTIKLSFLVFFRRLIQNFRGHIVWWWFMLAFTVTTWVTCIRDIQYSCLLNSLSCVAGTNLPMHTSQASIFVTLNPSREQHRH
jgi:hypothetical protein